MKSIFIIIIATLVLASCSVVSKQVRETAVTVPSFVELVDDIDTYRHQTVILGGHVLDIRNAPDGTVINALQVPLKAGDKPGSKDDSKGRLIIQTSEFLDPEVYTKGRKITVAGKIIAGSRKVAETAPLPSLTLKATEVHLWPQYRAQRYRYPYDDPFWYWDHPRYGWHSPFYFHGYWHGHRYHRLHRRYH